MTGAEAIPQEPIEIGHEPQFLFDNYVVDNHWAIKYKREAVQRVFHQAKKHEANPIMTGDQPSYAWVVRDEQSGVFRMYYQANFRNSVPDDEKGRKYRTHIAYAESNDGMDWKKPDLKFFSWHNSKPNNVVIGRQDVPNMESCGPCILDVPKTDHDGYRYLMLYRAKGRALGELSGIRVIGSKDGVHWEEESDAAIAHLHSDHHNTISYDSSRKQYVMYCRAKHIYRAFGDTMLDTGASRRVARMTSKSLRTGWLENNKPQTVLTPDEIDSERHFNFFYGMPTRHWAGVYWGFLEPFRMNDFIYTELALSRDGINFIRPPDRAKLIEYGDEGSWDDEMIFASPSWVEVGDEWWIYYSGWDGPHGTTDRTGAIGLAKIRKEGFVSIRGPRGGGVVCTRTLCWPGGNLVVNCNATDGELRVRLSDDHRKPIDGFDYEDCETFDGDNVAHPISWKNHSISSLKGKIVRLEFYLKQADLFSFRADAAK